MAERKIDFVFDSEKDNGKEIQLANGHISTTGILFSKEKFVAVIDAGGTVEFFRADECVAKADLPKVDSGKGVYDAVICSVNGNSAEFSFPIYQWIDTYPNCDGEHDRWVTRKVGSENFVFDFEKNEVR